MSKNLPEQQQSEEVDLGQLFKLIGQAFQRFFNFIGSILNKLFLAFVWLVFFVKRHFIKLAIAGLIGIAYGFVQKKFSEPVYKSTAVIKQNYNTGESLYTLLDYLNELINQQDSIALGNVLGLKPEAAANISSFQAESILNNNQKLQLFDKYTKELDSTLATTVEYKDFLANSDEFNHQYQRISIQATSKATFTDAFKAVVDNIESSAFFKNEQKKDLVELDRKEDLLLESLKESDSLQKVYQTVLEASALKTPGSQTSINIDNTEDKSITKEFELYTKDLELRRELASIRREKEDIANIIEIVSMQQSEGSIDESFSMLGLKIESKIVLGLIFAFGLFVVLLGFEFLRYLERYKEKV